MGELFAAVDNWNKTGNWQAGSQLTGVGFIPWEEEKFILGNLETSNNSLLSYSKKVNFIDLY